jgi:hypothetical protein
MTDHELVTRIESLTLSPGEFRHREHVRLAFALLHGRDFGDGALRFRSALKRFAASVGAAGKYHETLTWAWLALVAERMAAGTYASSDAFLAVHPDLLDHTALAARYDLAAITASPLARAVFVLPTRT